MGKPQYPEKNLSEQGREQTQPIYAAGSGNRIRVGGGRPHHCAIPAPLTRCRLKLIHEMVWFPTNLFHQTIKPFCGFGTRSSSDQKFSKFFQSRHLEKYICLPKCSCAPRSTPVYLALAFVALWYWLATSLYVVEVRISKLLTTLFSLTLSCCFFEFFD